MHGLLALLSSPNVSDAYGDVLQVYPVWLRQGLEGTWLGIDAPWVYPLPAWLPILAAGALGPEALPVLWMLLVTLLDAIAFRLLLEIPRGRLLACTWLGLQLALGPVALGRIDTVAVAVTIVGLVALRLGRTGAAAGVLTAAAWLKIWPGVLYLALLIARRPRLPILAAGALVSGAVLLVAGMLGSGFPLSFLSEQGDRGLQIEAVAATPYLWLAAIGDATRVEFDRGIWTYQVTGPGVDAVAAFATPALIAMVAVVSALGVVAVRRQRGREAIGWLALALVEVLLVTNKVGSPQFAMWLVVPALLLAEEGGRRRWRAVAAVAAVSLVTQLQFPWTYDWLVMSHPLAVLLLTLRSLGHVALLALAVGMLVRIARERAADARPGSGASAEERREQVADAVGLDEEGVVAEGALEHDRLGARRARRDARREPPLVGDGEEAIARDADDERR